MAVKNGSNINIVHTDYLTTPRIVTSGGSIVWQWRNDNPYGNNLAQGTIEFNLRFAGQYYDAESGFHYNIHRTYNPEIGRYMQSDPLGLSAGSNTYNYVGRNPFDDVDPLGLYEIVYPLEHKSSLMNSFEQSSFSGVFSWLIDHTLGNGVFMPIETLIKSNRKTSDNELVLDGHGSMFSFSGLTSKELANQIISGNFNTGLDKFSFKYFEYRVKNNLDINITLNACDTGIIDKSGYSFSWSLGNILKEAAGKDYKGKIKIKAPNGISQYIWGYGETVSQDKSTDIVKRNPINTDFNGFTIREF